MFHFLFDVHHVVINYITSMQKTHDIKSMRQSKGWIFDKCAKNSIVSSVCGVQGTLPYRTLFQQAFKVEGWVSLWSYSF